MEPLRLLAIFAHPDDESMAVGTTLAAYAAQGIETFLLLATRGEHGWQGAPEATPGPARLGEIREAEARAAARVLGLQDIHFLEYVDGELDQADPVEAIAQIVAHVRRVRPQVVLTFAPDGAYGHPDHIAISQLTTAALVASPDATYAPSGLPAYRVAKLYYFVETEPLARSFQELFGELTMVIDGVARRLVAWPEWALTTEIDADAHWQSAWRAILCHQSQLPTFGALEGYLDAHHRTLLGVRHFYRAYSLVNGGPVRERDLFEGLR